MDFLKGNWTRRSFGEAKEVNYFPRRAAMCPATIHRSKTVQIFVVGFCLGVGLHIISDPLLEFRCSLRDSPNPETDAEKETVTYKLLQVDEGKYDARYNLAADPVKAVKPRTIVRPRYFATELGMREKLLVAILSSQDTVGSLATALNKTLSPHVHKIVYFVDDVGQGGKLAVSMPGIVAFLDKLETLKMYHVLKYLISKFLNEFDYVLLVKDTTYVQVRKLLHIVKKISVSEDLYKGVPLKDHPQFCSLEGGILLSNSVLKKIGAKLDWCARNSNSNDDSINLGECVVYATNQRCRRSVNKQNFYSLQLPDTTSDDLWKSILNSRLQDAVTVSRVKDPGTFYGLHIVFSQENLKAIHSNMLSFQTSILNMSHLTPDGPSEVPWPVGSNQFHKATKRFDVPKWNYFNETHLFSDSDFSNIKCLHGVDKLDVMDVVKSCLRYVQEKHNERIQEISLLNGYRRFDPTRGMDYIVDVAVHDANGQRIPERLELSRPLSKVEIVPMPYVTENTRINMILPVQTRDLQSAETFISQYVKACMERRGNTFLMLVLLYELRLPANQDEDPFHKLKKLALDFSVKYKRDSMKIGWTSKAMTPVLVSLDSVARKFSQDSLILLCQPTMEIHDEYLNRIRMNTIRGWQAFSPIPFTRYHPDVAFVEEKPVNGQVNKNHGHYDAHNFNHLSFYAGDYIRAKKMIQVSGGERIRMSFYDVFVSAKNVHVMRAVEPRLQLQYQPIDCSGRIQSDSCEAQQAESFGTRSQMANLILDSRHE